MNNKASITALMSAFGRAFHTENEDHPVFTDHLAKELMTAEEYAAVQGYILGGALFFEPEIGSAAWEPKELVRKIVNTHIAPSPLCRSAYTEQALKTAVLTGTKQYVILGAGLDTFAFREKSFFLSTKFLKLIVPQCRRISGSESFAPAGRFLTISPLPRGFCKRQLDGTADSRRL